MTIGSRIAERLHVLQKSQSWLARAVGLHQSTINGIIRGSQRGTVHIVAIAEALETNPAYLTGLTEDPAADALPAVPQWEPTTVMLPVMLPPEYVLRDMFRGLLASMPDTSGDALAHELAKLLPIALGHLKGPFRYDMSDAVDEAVVDAATPDVASPKRQRA